MSFIIVSCRFCGKKNRMPSERIGQKAKCGSCSQYISDGIEGISSCFLCQKSVSTEVNLSNGLVCHESCLKNLQDRREKIESEVSEKELKIKFIKQKIEKHNSIAYKLKSIFSNPKKEIEGLNSKISVFKSEIEKLSSELSYKKKILSFTYDYYLSYPPDWDERKQLLINTEGNVCSNCGSRSNLHLHHIKPLSKGGTNLISNLELLCNTCHSDEHGGRDFSKEFNNKQTPFSKRLSDIQYAIKTGKKIKFMYRKPNDEKFDQRTVHPVRLVKMDHHHNKSDFTLCVTGYCELRKAERTFALKRMKGLKVI